MKILFSFSAIAFATLISPNLMLAGEPIPILSISKAAQIAEAELTQLKASETHYIKSISLIGNKYRATIEPPLPEDPSNPDGKKISISVSMDGSATHYGVTVERRIIRSSLSQPAIKAQQDAAANP